MNRLFYCNHKEDNGFHITGDDHRHALKVLRLKLHDTIEIIDGSGLIFHCSISEISKRQLIANIQSTSKQPPPPYQLGIAISPVKNVSRFEWFLEKSVEIGVTDIYPLICKRTEKPGIKYERCRKIIHAAMKQSLNVYEPTLHPLVKISDLPSVQGWNDRFLAYIHEEVTKKLSTVESLDHRILIAIGPEGGFMNEEAEMLMSHQFTPVSLGESRLRTETAGIVSCQIIKTLYERTKLNN